MENQTAIRWNDPNFPFRPLNRSTVLQYFEHSPFYDHDSNNREARARGLDPANDLAFRALPMDRPEFVLAECEEPHLFVIRRQVRQSAAGGRPVVQAYYYVIGGEAYTFQAPSLHAVATGRLRRCMHFVQQGFQQFKTDLAPLPKILSEQTAREQQQQQEEQQQQQQQQQGLADQQQGPRGQQRGANGAAPTPAAAAAPLPVPEVLTPAERRYWEVSDGVIMQVLRKYPAPHLPTPPPSTPPPPGPAAPNPQQQLQQQQQQQQLQGQQQQPQAAQQQQQQQQQAAAVQQLLQQQAAAAPALAGGGGGAAAAAAAAAADLRGSRGAAARRSSTPPTSAGAATPEVPSQQLAPPPPHPHLAPPPHPLHPPGQQQVAGSVGPSVSGGSLATGASRMGKMKIKLKGLGKKRQSSAEAGGSAGQAPGEGGSGGEPPTAKRQRM